MPTPSTAARSTFSTRASSIARALDEIGDKWCLLVLQQVFLGVNDFNGMIRATGVSRGVLSDRLRWLQQKNCLQRREKAPAARRFSYHLTDKSRDLYANALMALVWERQFFPSTALDSISLTHSLCRQEFSPELCCSSCRCEVKATDIEFLPGPGATRDTRLKKVRRRSSTPLSGRDQNARLYKNLIRLVGDRWTANLIALAFHGLQRFDQFQKELPISSNILSDRLNALVEQDVFLQRAYQRNPTRFDYRLTAKGMALLPWFLTLMQWGDRWCDDDGRGRPMLVIHTACRKELYAKVICGTCQRELEAYAVKVDLEKR